MRVPLRTSDKLMILAGAAAIGWSLSFVVGDIRNYKKYEPVQKQDDWCFSKTIQSGESITESGPGQYDYQLIVTTKGVDVYTLCVK